MCSLSDALFNYDAESTNRQSIDSAQDADDDGLAENIDIVHLVPGARVPICYFVEAFDEKREDCVPPRAGMDDTEELTAANREASFCPDSTTQPINDAWSKQRENLLLDADDFWQALIPAVETSAIAIISKRHAYLRQMYGASLPNGVSNRRNSAPERSDAAVCLVPDSSADNGYRITRRSGGCDTSMSANEYTPPSFIGEQTELPVAEPV